MVSAYSSSFDNFTISSGRYTYNGQVTGVDFNALKEMGYSFDQGGFPEGEDMSNMIVFGPDALYNWMDRKNNYVNQIPDAEGNIPDPYVDVMKDKIELTINRQDEQNTKRPPEYKITCTGRLHQRLGEEPGAQLLGVYGRALFAVAPGRLQQVQQRQGRPDQGQVL